MTRLPVWLTRAWPVLLVTAALAAAYAAGLGRALSFAALAQHQAALRDYAAAEPVLSAVAFTALYAAAAAIMLPGVVVLTVTGGLVFGTLGGAACTVVGATAGASVLFLAARHALAGWAAARAGPLLDRVRPGLQRDGLSYLLALRLVPIFPFWLVNLAAAVVGMPLRVFALGTVVGIIPGTVVFASIGAGLGDVLAAGRAPDVAMFTRPAVLFPLLCLALLALLPVAWRRWGRARA